MLKILILLFSTILIANQVKRPIVPIKKEVSNLSQPSVFKENNDVYKSYLNYLIKNGIVSENNIKLLLKSEKDSVLKNMLNGIYYDYEKNQPYIAIDYFSKIVKYKKDDIIGSINGIYISDFLIRGNQFKLISEILPKGSCELIDDEYKSKCYYLQAVSNYNLNKNYYIELDYAQSEKKGIEFKEFIEKKRDKK